MIMLFSLKRIFHNIRRRFGVYLIFMLEFAVGVAMLSSALNVVFSLQKDLDETREKTSEAIVIVYHETDFSPFSFMDEKLITPWEEDIAISYDAYLRAEKTYGEDLELRYTLKTDNMFVPVFENNSSKISYSSYLSVYYINNAKFRKIFGTDMEPGKIYAGEEAFAELNKLLDYSKKPGCVLGKDEDYPWSFYFTDGKLTYFDGREIELVPAPPTEQEVFMDVADVPKKYLPKVSAMICVPIEEFRTYRDVVRRNFNPYNNYWETIEIVEDNTDEDGKRAVTTRQKPHYQQPNFTAFLSVKYKSDDADVNIIPSLITELNSTKPELEFSMNEEVLKLQQLMDSYDQLLTTQIIRSAGVLLIVVLGTTGLLLIFLYQRKKQMAVSIAYGSTKGTAFRGAFLGNSADNRLRNGAWAFRP